jgi:macrolide-specific efflux system membrane fusion protein
MVTRKGVGYLLPERPEGCFAQKVPDPFPSQQRYARILVRWCLILAAALLPAGVSAAIAETIHVDSVLLAPIEEVEVPAQEAGLLLKLFAQEGSLIEKDDLLAQIDDTDAKLDQERAAIQLDNAKRNAGNDIRVRVSRKASLVADAELQRALDARKRYPKSVSETEVDRLRLSAEHAKLQIEQAEFEFDTAQLALKLNENELRRATRQVDRRKITAPLSGRVVQVFRREGEWVEPGKPVVRILRVDRLKAIGFLKAGKAPADITGRPVTLKLRAQEGPEAEYQGKVTFMQPEVNPVNGQFDFWAEIENTDLTLRPGLRAAMIIEDR